MAITIHFITVVVRIKTIERKYPGGIDAFVKHHVILRDTNLVGVKFMNSGDAQEFIAELTKLGFTYIVKGEYDEIAVVDQFLGLSLSCKWLETRTPNLIDNKARLSTCWLKGSQDESIGIRLSKECDPSLWKNKVFNA